MDYNNELIRYRRKKLNLTQRKTAQLCKMPLPTYSQIEQGRAKCGLYSLLKLCKYMNLDPEQIMHPDQLKKKLEAHYRIDKLIEEVIG